jgi:Lon protease-like protein
MLPLFPLGLVHFPGVVLPLHVFEGRYRTLVADLLALPEDQREFGIIAIREGREVGADGITALYDVGCATVLREADRQDDGRYDLLTVGTRAFRVLELLPPDDDRPYFAADVSWLTEDEPEPDAVASLDRAVREALADYLDALCTASGSPPPELDLPQDPRDLAHLVGAIVLLDLPDRQDLLERLDTRARLRRELSLLRRETGLLTHLQAVPAPDLVRTPYVEN